MSPMLGALLCFFHIKQDIHEWVCHKLGIEILKTCDDVLLSTKTFIVGHCDFDASVASCLIVTFDNCLANFTSF